jgi:PhzF family phenazine biosynthesis protein
MKLKIYHVDAFAEKLFSGNPAAVCPLPAWLSETEMKNIAMENNLSETAFYVKEGNNYGIRWFTAGGVEVELCGHATLATSHVLFNHEGYKGNEINFNSRGGILKVKKHADGITLNFPTDKYERVKTPAELSISLNVQPKECYKGRTDYMLVFETEEQILKLKPNFTTMALISDARGVVCTAKGTKADFVSRFFGPQSGIDEDPVTGSAHTTLTPYWAKVLGKKELHAMQLSSRKGYLKCVDLGDRVEISGKALTYMIGEIHIG